MLRRFRSEMRAAARAAFKSRRLERAKAQLEAPLPRGADAAACRERLAGIYRLLGDWKLGRVEVGAGLDVLREAQSALEVMRYACGGEARFWLALATVKARLQDKAGAAGALRELLLAGNAKLDLLIAAARLAREAGLSAEAHALYGAAVATEPPPEKLVEAARFYAAAQSAEQAIGLWTRLLPIAKWTGEAINQISRIRFLEGQFAEAAELIEAHAGVLLGDLDKGNGGAQKRAVMIFNRYVDCAYRLDGARRVRWLLDLLHASGGAGPVAASLRARLYDMLGSKSAAERELAAALAAAAPEDVTINVHAEAAVHYIRYGLYEEAQRAFCRVAPEALPPGNRYETRLRIFDAVRSRYAGAVRFYPECLLGDIFAAGSAAPIGYRPEARRVLMVCGSLGQGGGEKQTVTVARSLIERGASPYLHLAVRWTDRRPSDDFFLPAVRSLPIGLEIYGSNWLQASDLGTALPELADRGELAGCLELLPHNMREEIVRVARLILDIRPQAVHIWQDMPAVAVACMLCGVPRYFIHRGSLSPDYWEFNELQWHTHFRPMQFIYKNLLQSANFFFVNNCDIGCRTDANWVESERDGRFRVLYNAVQFDALGENCGANRALRAELGIPQSAPVVGGSFRLHPVKRPLLWMETAKLVLTAIPEAHFVIIGGGEMTEEIADYARRGGFADRLHLPGRVSDVGAWYRIMNVKLLTSEREGIPNAIIEAQHFGVPVVATDVGGISEALDPGVTGYVITEAAIKAAAADAFAQRLIEILPDAAWRARAAARAPAFVHERFSLERVLSQLQAYYGWDHTIAAAAQ